MKKQYCAPFLTVARLQMVDIATVSTETEWGDGWDESMNGDTTEASDEA